jgi:hypothetical protein
MADAVFHSYRRRVYISPIDPNSTGRPDVLGELIDRDGLIWRSQLMKTSVFGFFLVACSFGSLHAQAAPTASKRFDFQAGGGFVLDYSDYGTRAYRGVAAYTTLDFSTHFGGEFDFHQANSPVDKTYERTYEMGGRYHRAYGRFSPYAKVMYGRGVFNFVTDGQVVANLAYNEIVFGGGTDFRVTPWLNVRGDYEYQMWHSFPPNGLTPQLLTFGIAYHFPGGLKKGERFR